MSSRSVILENHSIIGASGLISACGIWITIGDNSSFDDYILFGAAGGLHIGNYIILGTLVSFYAENHNYEKGNVLFREQGVNWKGIKIGNNYWLGLGAVFLYGSSIGNGCVVVANSVFTKFISR